MDKTYGNFNNVKYVRNYDGDTVKVNIPEIPRLFGEEISVRIRGIDTPEIKGKTPCEKELALKAKAFVGNSLKQAIQIDLLETARDKYFRILSNISYDNKDLSIELVANHLAVPYDGGTKPNVDWCNQQSLFIGETHEQEL